LPHSKTKLIEDYTIYIDIKQNLIDDLHNNLFYEILEKQVPIIQQHY